MRWQSVERAAVVAVIAAFPLLGASGGDASPSWSSIEKQAPPDRAPRVTRPDAPLRPRRSDQHVPGQLSRQFPRPPACSAYSWCSTMAICRRPLPARPARSGSGRPGLRGVRQRLDARLPPGRPQLPGLRRLRPGRQRPHARTRAPQASTSLRTTAPPIATTTRQPSSDARLGPADRPSTSETSEPPNGPRRRLHPRNGPAGWRSPAAAQQPDDPREHLGDPRPQPRRSPRRHPGQRGRGRSNRNFSSDWSRSAGAAILSTRVPIRSRSRRR